MNMEVVKNTLKELLTLLWMRCFAGKGELGRLLSDTVVIYPEFISSLECEELVSAIEMCLKIRLIQEFGWILWVLTEGY